MTQQKTLSIIKPDGVQAHVIGKIIAMFEEHGLRVVAARMIHMSKEQAGAFYAVHKNRPFFGSLVDYMTSGPVFVMVLQGKEAIAKNREIMGATDPQKAEPGTIRKLYGKNFEANVVHGSDAEATAKEEISFFFSALDVITH